MYVDANGVRTLAGSNVIRTTFFRGQPYYLIEGSRTNAWTNSRSFGGAEWVKVSSDCVANAAFGTRSDGTGDAFRLREVAATSEHSQERSNPTTASARQAWAGTFKAGERSTMRVTTIDRAGTLATSHIDIANVALGNVAAAHRIALWFRRDGWVRVFLSFDAGAGAGPNVTVRWGPTTALNGALSYAGVGGWGINQDDIQFEQDCGWCSSEIETAGATASRVADDFSVPFLWPTRGRFTVYVRHIDLSQAFENTNNTRLFDLRTPTYNGATGSIRLLQKSGGGNNTISVFPGGNNFVADVPNASAMGVVENAIRINAGAAVESESYLNGVASTSQTGSVLTALPEPRFSRIHILPSPSGVGVNGLVMFDRLVIARGWRSVPQMRT